MLKKLSILAAGALFSLNASASYIEYNFSGPLSGYIIERADSSIAYYALNVNGVNVHAHFAPSGEFDHLWGGVSINSNFPQGGPVNFGAYDNLTDYYVEYLNVQLYSTSPGQYIYGAGYSQTKIPDLPPTAPYFPVAFGFQGTVTGQAISDESGALYDSQDGFLSAGAPQVKDVPEPASLALIAIGAIGAVGLSRRRKS